MSAPRVAWVIGATSVLGYGILRAVEPGWVMVPWCSRHQRSSATRDWRRLDVERARDWEPLTEERPDVLLYCGGVCNVARCEADPGFAHRINVGGVAAMLEALPSTTRLVYCSSDHVFGGNDRGPCTESTEPRPMSAYGRTRVEAERLILHTRPDALVARIGLPIGPSLSGRIGHLDWLRHRHQAGLPMTIVAGEARSAVLTSAAAERIVALARADVRGIRHLVASEVVERPRLAARLCAQLGIEIPRYEVVSRDDLGVPHLGVIELRTEHSDSLAQPLPSPFPEGVQAR